MDKLVSPFKPAAGAEAAMHGVRPMDRNSVNRFRDDPEKLDYLKSTVTVIRPALDWVADRYGYDVALD